MNGAAMAVESGFEATFAYHLLRAALDTFQRNLAELQPHERSRVEDIAAKSQHIESLVLASDEARDLFVLPQDIEQAFASVRGRYADGEEFTDDLLRNGLDETGLREALRRELLFDGVMQRIGARAAMVNDLDIRLFYEMHRERFSLAEKRLARHILITRNDAYPENTAPVAYARARELADRLAAKPKRFDSAARQHSECPTALEGGRLGLVSRGQLYPELDRVLFSMAQGSVSDVVESEVGYHVLLCERVQPRRDVPLSKARDGIHEILVQRKQRNCQKAWLGELRRAADAREVS